MHPWVCCPLTSNPLVLLKRQVTLKEVNDLPRTQPISSKASNQDPHLSLWIPCLFYPPYNVLAFQATGIVFKFPRLSLLPVYHSGHFPGVYYLQKDIQDDIIFLPAQSCRNWESSSYAMWCCISGLISRWNSQGAIFQLIKSCRLKNTKAFELLYM